MEIFFCLPTLIKRYNVLEVNVMEKKLVVKMIRNCFKQYYAREPMPLGGQELAELTNRILQAKAEEPTAELYEVVNNFVYEFLAEEGNFHKSQFQIHLNFRLL